MLEPYVFNQTTIIVFAAAMVLALLLGLLVGPAAGLAIVALGVLATVIADAYLVKDPEGPARPSAGS